MAVDMNLDEIELGFVINLATLRDVLKNLSVLGRRWWIASDPVDALVNGYVTIGHGDPACFDRLNTLYFKAPILNYEKPAGGTDRLVVLLETSVIMPECPGFYWEGGRILQDSFSDIECFYLPLKKALIEMLKTE